MKRIRMAAPLLALALLGTGAGVAQYGPPQYGPPPGRYQGPPSGYGAGGWDVPPREFREFQQRGFHDGIEGARRDIENHRRPNVNNRDEYRRPPVPREVRGDYRNAFRRGYDVAMQHMLGGGGPRRPY